MTEISISEIGLAMVVFGFVLAFIAVILLATKSSTEGRHRGAGVLLIGPIPIIFGTDRESARILIGLAIVLIIAVLALMLLPAFIFRR